jgi:predicted permease
VSNRPPRIAEWILNRMVVGRDGEAVAGDLREEWQARGGGRLWYFVQVLSCLVMRLSPHRRWIPDLRYDCHYALRTLRRNPGYGAAAVVCLGLGIGANTVIFSVLDGMFLQRLPVAQANRVVVVNRAGGPACTWEEYVKLQGTLRSLSGLAAVIPKGTFLDFGRANDKVLVEAVSVSFADTLRLPPQAGRWFDSRDETPSSEPVAVISDRLWQRHFQRDPRAVGKWVRIENQWYKVVGVAGPEFHGASPPLLADAWIPIATYPLFRGRNPGVYLLGRLSGSLDEARSEMHVIERRVEHRPGTPARLSVRKARGYIFTGIRRAIVPLAALLSGVMAIVLLIACVNVANLLLARAAVRRKEVALRISLGATPGRLMRQVLTEGLLLAIAGASVGVLLGHWTGLALAAWIPERVPGTELRTLISFDVSWRVGLLMSLLALGCAVLCSLAPALECSRQKLTPALKDESGAGTRHRRQREAYVVTQVALSLVLLVAGALLTRELRHAVATDPGFAVDHRLYVRLFTPEPDFTPVTSRQLYLRLVNEARMLPGVRNATLSFAILGFTDGDCASTREGGEPRRVNLNVVQPNYFSMMRVPLVRGRNFGPADTPGSRRAVIVNETMAQRFFPGEDPIGKLLYFGCEARGQGEEAEVIGVARDSKYTSLEETPRPFYYMSAEQVWWNGFFALIVETEGNPYALAGPLLKLARTSDRNLRIYEVKSMDDVVASSLWLMRTFGELLGAFGILAVVLAAVGLYGVVAYSVAQRTREIGLRMALGAGAGDVRWMVLSRALWLTATGIVIGFGLSACAAPLLGRWLAGVSPFDPASFAGAGLLWVLVAMLASYVPSARAMRVDPVTALRYE